MKKLILISIVAFALCGASVLSQTPQTTAPPGTDVFIAAFDEKGGKARISKPMNITKRQGYDNQPMFMPDGKSLLYTSIREDKQADTYRYDFEPRATARMIATTESEYSPTVTPDGKYFSVIRVEADSTQRLWKFPLAGGEPRLVLEKIKPVGYHVWVDENTLVVYVLGTPNTLQLVEATTGKTETVAENVGRSLRLIPREPKVSFVRKVSADEWMISAFDARTRKITSIIKTLPGSEDHAWTPGGLLLMAKGARIFKYNPSSDKDWQEVADFSGEGINAITRLAVSPKADRIAFVAGDIQ